MATIKRIGKDKNGVPIWEAVYRRGKGKNAKQVRRRFHTRAKADVERAVLLDSEKPAVGLKWSEGMRLYLETKRLDGLSPGGLELIERAGNVFLELMGDMAVEDTEPAVMKDFMQKVVVRPLIGKKTGKIIRRSGPKVANHHCKALKTVARFLRGLDRITGIPFEHVPMLPAKRVRRSPVPSGQVNAYMEALPPHVRRPVLMVLYYGLRSTAICNLAPTPPTAPFLKALDKGGVERKIPIDNMLREILMEAETFRRTFANPAERLFVTVTGKAWNRTELLRAAQKAWVNAGLEKKKIHEIRHTLGTLASRKFNARMVQAAMGHRDEKSAAAYFHPDEEMAAEVREKIITELSHNDRKDGKTGESESTIMFDKSGQYQCPCCHCNILIVKE